MKVYIYQVTVQAFGKEPRTVLVGATDAADLPRALRIQGIQGAVMEFSRLSVVE